MEILSQKKIQLTRSEDTSMITNSQDNKGVSYGRRD